MFVNFLAALSYGPLSRLEIMLQGVRAFSTLENSVPPDYATGSGNMSHYRDFHPAYASFLITSGQRWPVVGQWWWIGNL